MLKVDLPEASEQAAVSQAEEPLVITVAANGELRVNDRELVNNRPDTLRAAITLTVGDERDIQVLLRADGKASHQSVVTAMDVLGRMGFRRLSIAAVATPEDSR